MEIQNASTTPSKSNQLRNVNTVGWESWNVTTQPLEINDRKSEVIAFVVKDIRHGRKIFNQHIAEGTRESHPQVIDRR